MLEELVDRTVGEETPEGEDQTAVLGEFRSVELELPGLDGRVGRLERFPAAGEEETPSGARPFGLDEELGTGPSGEYYRRPRVWMYNDDSVPFSMSRPPATVDWPFYCGRVLYTVYHTHSGSGGADYQLLLQEKIMMYLIIEVQTCVDDFLY